MSVPTYQSTRGDVMGLTFTDVLLKSLAQDGGLFVPSFIPKILKEEQEKWKGLSYTELCYCIMRKFISLEEFSKEDLQKIISSAYGEQFEIHGLLKWSHLPSDAYKKMYLVELFYGPTFSFKDYALQFLAQIINHILASRMEEAIILSATSGDTGSAIVHAFKGMETVTCFVLYPKGRISRIQELQMTTLRELNIHCLSVENATFDDCQSLVKSILVTVDKSRWNVLSANSINWGRVLAQIVYYWYIALNLGDEALDICVPTGNFGNILAAFYAKRMGAPLRNLIIASNTNDLLTRFYRTGHYSPEQVIPTLSPSMDIQVSSNFERLLYHLSTDSRLIRQLFEKNKCPRFQVENVMLSRFQKEFFAYSCSEIETKLIIEKVFKNTKMIIDPHTAVGIHCAYKYVQQTKTSNILAVIATAHFTKFYDSLVDLIDSRCLKEQLPKRVIELEKMEPKFYYIQNSEDEVLSYIKKCMHGKM